MAHALLRTCVLTMTYFGVHITCALAQGECPPQPAWRRWRSQAARCGPRERRSSWGARAI